MVWGSINSLFGFNPGSNRSGRRSSSSSTWANTSTCKIEAPLSLRDSSHSMISEKRRGSIVSLARTTSNSIMPFKNGARMTSWRGCLAMIAGIMQQMLCWGMIMTFGTILAYYTDYLLPRTPKYQLTLVGTIPPFLLLALALFWGRLLDAGHHRKLNIIAGICLFGGLTGLAFTGGNDGDGEGEGKYWAILLAAISMGIGQSIYFMAAPHMAKTWFPSNKGFAMGVTNSGAALGGVAWPFVFTSLTGAVDFRLGVGALAAISLIMSAFIAWAAMPAPSFTPHSVGEVRKVSNWIPIRAFRSHTFLFHIAAMCSIYLGTLTVPFLIEVWAQKNNLGVAEDVDKNGNPTHFDEDTDLTVYIVVAMNACQLPGRLLGSTVCDYVKARKIHALACIVALVEVGLAWNLARSYTDACVFASFFGLILGIMVSLPINDAQDILGKNRTHLLGQYAGMVYTCASPFILAGGIITGALVDRYHIKAAGIWACVTFGLGFILILSSLLIKDDTWKFDENVLPQTRTHAIESEGADDGFEKVDVHLPDVRRPSLDDAIMQVHF